MGTKISTMSNKQSPLKGNGCHLPLVKVEHPGSDHPQQPASRHLLFEKKYTVPMAAKMLGIGETKLRDLIRLGKMPVIMIDGKYLLLEGDLDAFLHSHYGAVREIDVQRSGITPLPQSVANSPLLKKAG